MNSYRTRTLAAGGIRPLMLGAITALVVSSGCGPVLEVHNLPGPEADLHGRVTFSVLEKPMSTDSVQPMRDTRDSGESREPRESRRMDGYGNNEVSGRALDEVMLNNRIIDRRVRDDITRAFTARGYVAVEDRPDFVVFYSTEAVEVTDWDDSYYNNSYYSPWWGYCCDVDEYTEATVVIDVIDPRNGELLWRGGGETRVSDNPSKYSRQLTRAVDAIVAKYPVATATAVAVGEDARDEAQ